MYVVNMEHLAKVASGGGNASGSGLNYVKPSKVAFLIYLDAI